MNLNKSRFERKKEETKNRIIRVAMALFKKQGVDETTMEQIAKEVDIAKGTLYSYFPVKEAIISDYMKQAFKEKNKDRILQFRKLKDTRTRLLVLFTELIEGIGANREIFEKYIIYRMRNMVSFHQEQSQKSGLNLLVLEIIELGQKENEIRTDIPIHVLEDLLEFAFVEVAKQFIIESKQGNNVSDIHVTINQCIDIFIHGAGKRKE
jgi:AcrR family transcriptional regulator